MNDTRLSRVERRCFVCGAVLPWSEGLAWGSYGFLTHRAGSCAALVAAQERIYDRSPRGRWRPTSDVRRRVRAHRYLLALEQAVLHAEETEAYAMTDLLHGFWYRSYVCLPLGDTWRFDTTSERLVPRAGAHAIIRASRTHHSPLRLTTLDALLRNWQHYGIWAHARPLGTALLQRWADLHGQVLHGVPERRAS